MSTLNIPLPQSQSSYHASPEFSADSFLPNVRHADPDEAAREELLLTKLGPVGWGRIHHFRHFYTQGWGERGRGRTLSPRALESFYRFLEALPVPTRARPKVFLTDDGHPELIWKDAAGASVQLEFTPAQVEYYIESSDTEGTMPHARISELPGRLPAP